MPLRIAVAVATLGRPELVARTVARLASQTRPADLVIVSAVSEADVRGLAEAAPDARLLLGDQGSCRQRNHALDEIGSDADVVVFFDDDFVPAPDYLEQVEALFAARPELAGATGGLIADGVRDQGYTVDEAERLIAESDGAASYEIAQEALYGCNMCVSVGHLGGLRFDENLPLYGWQEDIDFTFQLGARGQLIKSSRLSGVHLGVKGGRTSGLRFGYSQIANPIYLLRKRTMPKALGHRLMRKNLMANIAKSLFPEPHIDRIGRLKGNLIALRDLATGRLDPRRILEFR